MRGGKRTQTEEPAGLRARGFVIFAGGFFDNPAAAGAVVAAGLLCAVALSPRLWFPLGRSFPRAPLLFDLPTTLTHAAEYTLSCLLVVSLVALPFGRRPKLCSTLAVSLLALLLLLDQTRLQPWAYQYLLLLALLALRQRPGGGASADARTLSLMLLVVASLYFWGGVQKLNYAFSREVLPQLLAPLEGRLPLTQSQLTALGVGVALFEVGVGCGLLLRRTRKPSVLLALAMHVLLLGLLIGEGRNSVVWPWNAALMALVLVLFWRGGGSVRHALSRWGAADAAGRAARLIALACAVLPLASFWGWWDVYLSGALYSGNTAVAVVRVDEKALGSLPPTAARQVFETGSGELMLPVFEWASADLNVPPYPEPRVFRRVAREVCKSAGGESRVELIVRGRPAVTDGSFKVDRMNCSQLGD
jgi:hypothetical protein